MLGRRRQTGGEQAGADDIAGYEDETGAGESGGELAIPDGTGPWDAEDGYPPGERVDCGSLLIPVREGFDVQIHVAEELGVWVAVIRGDTGLQLQAFAAPKTLGIWEDVRQEIAENVAAGGGRWEEAKGPYGAEIRAWVLPAGPGQAPDAEPQLVRFLGADGPRWFLRGVLSGPGAFDPDAAAPFEEIFADVVVVRGSHPAPPREPLEIRLPEAAREAMDAAAAAEDEPGWPSLNPFERGPEITEIR